MMKRTIFLFLLVLLVAPGSWAQSRIAFVDASMLLKKMPEAADVESRLNQLVDGWNREANDMQTELDRKRTEYERKKLIMTDAERTAIETDITDLKSRIEKFRQDKYGPNGELFSQQSTLMKPVYDKFLKALEEVALDEKYDYVFDRGANDHSMLFGNAKFDLSAKVAKKLGLETNDIFSPLLDRVKTPNDQRTPGTAPGQPPPPHTQTPPQNPGETPKPIK
jgi:outer membrane protein